MERSKGAAFGPLDRIGQLTMRDLDIQDSRAKLEQYAERRLLTADTDALGLLPSAEPETPAE
jgi:argininosuccinate synthase